MTDGFESIECQSVGVVQLRNQLEMYKIMATDTMSSKNCRLYRNLKEPGFEHRKREILDQEIVGLFCLKTVPHCMTVFCRPNNHRMRLVENYFVTIFWIGLSSSQIMACAAENATFKNVRPSR